MMVLRNIILVPYMWIRLCWHATHVDKYTLAEHFKILRYIVAHANKGGNVKKMCIRDRCEEGKTGTKVTFMPDDTIFEETVFDYNILKQRFREMAFLTKGLKIVLRDEREEELIERTFHYEGGIKEFVTYLNKSKEALYEDVIYCEGMVNNVQVEVCLLYTSHRQIRQCKESLHII